jgi:single-stranded DNA-binding protein
MESKNSCKALVSNAEDTTETRYSTKIVVNGIGGNIQFLDKKENNASSLPKKTAKVTATQRYLLCSSLL